MRVVRVVSVILFLCVATSLQAAKVGMSVVEQWLKDAGAITFSHQEGVSPILQDVYLGYDAKGDVVVGIAGRAIKTYHKVDGYIAIVPGMDGSFSVMGVNIPELETKIDDKGGKQTKIKGALRAIAGKEIVASDGTLKVVDAVTGATSYHKAVYSGFNALATQVIDEMKRKPDWPRQNF